MSAHPCKFCHTEIRNLKHPSQKFCSHSCYVNAYRGKPRWNSGMKGQWAISKQFTCKFCHKQFTRRNDGNDYKFCNQVCYGKSMEGKAHPTPWLVGKRPHNWLGERYIKCLQCLKLFIPKSGKWNMKFCSKPCYSKWQTTHFDPEVARQRGIQSFLKFSKSNRRWNTSIEQKVQKVLDELTVTYRHQALLCKVAIVDFYLPEYNAVIECDGDYWHSLAHIQEKDKKRDMVLTSSGIKIFRITESDINKDAKTSVQQVLNQLEGSPSCLNNS